MIQKAIKFTCKYCGTIELIPDREFGLRTTDITCVYCPKCYAKGKQRRMLKNEYS